MNDDAGPPPLEYSPITHTPVITLLKGYVKAKSSAAWSSNAAIAGSNFWEPMPRGGSVAGLSYWFHRLPPIGNSGIARAPAPLSLEVAESCAMFAVALRSPVVRC